MPGRLPHAHRPPARSVVLVRPIEALAFLLSLAVVVVGLAIFLATGPVPA